MLTSPKPARPAVVDGATPPSRSSDGGAADDDTEDGSFPSVPRQGADDAEHLGSPDRDAYRAAHADSAKVVAANDTAERRDDVPADGDKRNEYDRPADTYTPRDDLRADTGKSAAVGDAAAALATDGETDRFTRELNTTPHDHSQDVSPIVIRQLAAVGLDASDLPAIAEYLRG